MKHLFKIIFLFILISFFSCKEEKEKVVSNEVVVEQIEAVEKEVEDINEEIETRTEELEIELNQLENL